jgi:transcriptional regulator with XRE-family HTH domain
MQEDFRFDPLVFGKRLRHYRKKRGLTLRQLGDRVGKQAPYLSMLESGKREPRLSLIDLLAQALDVDTAELLRRDPPDKRSRLEVALEKAQQEPFYRDLHLPHIKASAGMPDEVLEHLVTLYGELKRIRMPATPAVAEARRANRELHLELRDRDCYLEDVEKLAADALRAVDYPGTGALPQRMLSDLARSFGFAVHQVQDLPASARSVVDLRSRRVYIPQRDALRTRQARRVVLQTLGHFALGHDGPESFSEYLRQQLQVNYFADAVLMPEVAAVPFLTDARDQNDLSIEDLKEVFYVSYETAAHRFTNLATRHLEVRTHFVRSDAQGIIWKAYENDGVPFPTGPDGGVEGERLCREWGTRRAFHSEDKFAIHYQHTETPAGAFWCSTHVAADEHPAHAVTVGVVAEDAGVFRGSDTVHQAVSNCPDGPCCRRPDPITAARWDSFTWAAPSAPSHVPPAMPAAAFPGVDMTAVYDFLERHAPSNGG